MPWTGSCTPRLSLDLPIQNYPPQFSIPSSTNQCAHAGILKFSVSYRSPTSLLDAVGWATGIGGGGPPST